MKRYNLKIVTAAFGSHERDCRKDVNSDWRKAIGKNVRRKGNALGGVSGVAPPGW